MKLEYAKFHKDRVLTVPEVSDIVSGQTGTSRKIHKGPCFYLGTPVSARLNGLLDDLDRTHKMFIKLSQTKTTVL